MIGCGAILPQRQQMSSSPRRFTLPRTRRLRGKLTYNSIFDGGIRESRGPIMIVARPNELSHPRLGLAVPRRVGTAARRNRIKRLLREAFRLLQHDFPRGYDLVVVVRPHEPMRLAEYQKTLSALMVRLHGMWTKRQKSSS
jgi:ribonuclease P protein component